MINASSREISGADVCDAVVSHQVSLASKVLEYPRQLLNTLAEWQYRKYSRAQLRDLNEHLLNDMGLTRSQASQEARKPFWIA